MLSKELKELELNNIVHRKIYDERPVRIEYELTDSGYMLKNLFLKLWLNGEQKHRTEALGQSEMEIE